MLYGSPILFLHCHVASLCPRSTEREDKVSCVCEVMKLCDIRVNEGDMHVIRSRYAAIYTRYKVT